MFKVIFGALSYPRRKWKVDMSECEFEYEVLSSHLTNLNNSESPIFSYKGLITLVMEEKPAVIITPAFSVATTKIWFLSLFKKIYYIIWSGTTVNINNKESLFRKIQRRILIKRASAFIAYGTKAKNYLISYGADPGKIKIGINTVDVNYFKKETERIKSYRKNNNKKILLYIGYLVKRKKVDSLFPIIKLLKDKREDFILRIIGDGPEFKYLKNKVKELNIDDYVSFEGFKQKSELVNYLAEADCFLFPTGYDIWGLVLLEGMAAGLPCLASKHSGAAYDLIRDGENGFIVDFTKKNEIVDKINYLLNNPEFLREIGRKAKDFVKENYTIKKSANGFVEAVESVINFTSRC